jgi:hypothetical protein
MERGVSMMFQRCVGRAEISSSALTWEMDGKSESFCSKTLKFSVELMVMIK